MSCEAKFDIPRNEVYYLDENILEEYNETMSLFKSFVPAIAVVELGSYGMPLKYKRYQYIFIEYT